MNQIFKFECLLFDKEWVCWFPVALVMQFISSPLGVHTLRAHKRAFIDQPIRPLLKNVCEYGPWRLSGNSFTGSSLRNVGYDVQAIAGISHNVCSTNVTAQCCGLQLAPHFESSVYCPWLGILSPSPFILTAHWGTHNLELWVRWRGRGSVAICMMHCAASITETISWEYICSGSVSPLSVGLDAMGQIKLRNSVTHQQWSVSEAGGYTQERLLQVFNKFLSLSLMLPSPLSSPPFSSSKHLICFQSLLEFSLILTEGTTRSAQEVQTEPKPASLSEGTKTELLIQETVVCRN